MRIFNLAEEIEKERKKNKELKQELKEANESITWWQNRFNSAEAEIRTFKSDFEAQAKLTTEYKNRIDKSAEVIRKYGYEKQMEEDYLMDRVNLANYNCLLLDILKGDNK